MGNNQYLLQIKKALNGKTNYDNIIENIRYQIQDGLVMKFNINTGVQYIMVKKKWVKLNNSCEII